MKSQLTSIQLERPKILRDQIRDAVRELIVTNQFAAGEQLPSTQALAETWGTDVRTVHAALTTLEKEGLLVRCHGKGTYVRRREAKLTCVGVYDTTGGIRGSLFEQALQAMLREELAAAGMEMDVWIDPRPQAEQGAPWLPLVRAAERWEFQALIATSADLPRLQWQQRLPVPTAFNSAPDIPTAVYLNLKQFADLSLGALARQGCRSVGLIFPGRPTKGGRQDLWAEFVTHFIDGARDRGMAVANRWMRLPGPAAADGSIVQEQFGYEEFRQLWQQPKRPDGLVVWPDTVARGVITAILEKRVRVPADLKLALHKHATVHLLCPVPATFLVSSEREFARALIAQVQKQFRGETCEPILISFDTVSNAGG